MPPFAHAWQCLGPIRPALARRYGLPDRLAIFTGAHDSSANFYRYQAAGLDDATIVSTGTWIVALSSLTPLERLDETRGMTCNSDVYARPLGGALTMGGREFSHVAGRQEDGLPAKEQIVRDLVARESFALPSFGDDDGLFPGSAGQGRFLGVSPETPSERKALAVLYSALLTVECLDALGSSGALVLDGNFLRDPLYATLVAALRPDNQTFFNLDTYGVAAGAALLVDHDLRGKPAAIALDRPQVYGGDLHSLATYAARWRQLATRTETILPHQTTTQQKVLS